MYKFLLFPFILLGCSNYIDPTTYGVVVSQTSAYEKPYCMYKLECPNNSCMYTENEITINIKDTCNKFNIDDTINLTLSKKTQ